MLIIFLKESVYTYVYTYMYIKSLFKTQTITQYMLLYSGYFFQCFIFKLLIFNISLEKLFCLWLSSLLLYGYIIICQLIQQFAIPTHVTMNKLVLYFIWHFLEPFNLIPEACLLPLWGTHIIILGNYNSEIIILN